MFIKLTSPEGEPFRMNINNIENYGDRYVSTRENNFPCSEKIEEIDALIAASLQFSVIGMEPTRKTEWK